MSSIWTTVEVTADLPHAAEKLRVRANLNDAAATVYVDYRTGQGRKADWQPTQFQTADARHRTSGLAAIGERLMASALETPEDDLETTWEDITAICDVADVLESHGDRFSGVDRKQAEEIAAEWVDAEFTADEVEAWAGAGVWDLDTAVDLHNNDMTPADVLAASAALVEASDDPAEEYTDGDPVYSVCNGDTDADVLIAAHNGELPAKPVTLRVTTTPGTNASAIGEVYAAYDGVSWRDSVDACDSDGCGRVFLDCDSADIANFVGKELDDDERVTEYGVM